jgi:hypothetical protein
MNKKILMATAAVAIMTISGLNISRSMNEPAMSDVALENVEALASGEGDRYGYYNPCEDCCDTGGSYLCYYDCK